VREIHTDVGHPTGELGYFVKPEKNLGTDPADRMKVWQTMRW
jgi:hypothetical protein